MTITEFLILVTTMAFVGAASIALAMLEEIETRENLEIRETEQKKGVPRATPKRAPALTPDVGEKKIILRGGQPR